MRKIIHVDMDCFFAAVEMRDNPPCAISLLLLAAAANVGGDQYRQLSRA